MKGKENKKRHLTVMTILEEKCGSRNKTRITYFASPVIYL
jgi:hypothetical protein